MYYHTYLHMQQLCITTLTGTCSSYVLPHLLAHAAATYYHTYLHMQQLRITALTGTWHMRQLRINALHE